MSIFGKSINETSLKSNIQNDYQSKGYKNINDFKMITIDKKFIEFLINEASTYCWCWRHWKRPVGRI